MKKRVTALFLVLLMVISMLVGCGSSKEVTTKETQVTTPSDAISGSKDSEKSESTLTDVIDTSAGSGDIELKDITIAVPMADSGMTFLNQLSYNLNSILGPAANATFVYQQITYDADGTLTFVESEIAAGVDGLFICPPSDSVLPTICTLCEEAEVYWGITMRTIEDEEIKAMCEASPYYVGNCYEDEEDTGYLVGQFLGEAGLKKVAIITTTKGDTTGDAREVGLATACEEYGIDIVGEARGLTQASDITNSVESFLAANPDLDAIFCVGTTVMGVQEITVKAVQDAKREEVQVVCIDHPEGITDLFETGILTYSVGTLTFALDSYICALKVANAVQGYALDGAKLKKISSNLITMTEVTSTEEAKQYEEVSSDDKFVIYSSEEISNMLKWNNSQFNEAALQSIIENYKIK